MPDGQTFCHGNGEDHCCYFGGEVCPFLRDDGPKPNKAGVRRWVCTLYEELGDWQGVHDDPRYLATVEPMWRGAGWVMEWLWDEGVRCGNWPDSIRGIKKPNPRDPMREEKQAQIDIAVGVWGQLQTDPDFMYSAWSCLGRRPEAGD